LKFRLLILILGVVLILVYGALAILIVGFSGPRAADTAATPESSAAEGPLTAREAYALAVSEARQWQEDAQLVNATASWADVSSEQQLGQDVAWGFTFLSASSREAKIVSVTRLGAESARDMPSTAAMRTADLTSWDIDSSEAVNLLLEHGGRDFISQHPGATITLRLGPEEQGTRLVWLALGIQSADRSTIVLEIDASTGEVLNATP
jgi:hypothetical protein